MDKQKINKFICYVFSFIFLLPFVFILANSFMNEVDISTNYLKTVHEGFSHLRIIPSRVTFSQYYDLLFQTPEFLNSFWNSVFITGSITIFNLLFSYYVSYALYRLDNKLTTIIFYMYMLVALMPYQVVCVPNFVVINRLNLMNSYLAVILPGVFNPVGVFLIRQFLNFVPKSYIESAKLDGASEFFIATNIVMSIIKKWLVVLTLINFTNYWNMVEEALIFLTDNSKQPLSIVLSYLSLENVSILFSGSVLYLIPAILLFIEQKEYIVDFDMDSGLK